MVTAPTPVVVTKPVVVAKPVVAKPVVAKPVDIVGEALTFEDKKLSHAVRAVARRTTGEDGAEPKVRKGKEPKAAREERKKRPVLAGVYQPPNRRPVTMESDLEARE